MTRIYIDTNELHQIASDLRGTTGEAGHVISDLWAGFGSTWVGAREGEFRARQAAQCAQLGVLAGRVEFDAGRLDVEAWAVTAEEATEHAAAEVFDYVRWHVRVFARDARHVGYDLEMAIKWAIALPPTIDAAKEALAYRLISDVVGSVFGVPGSRILHGIDDFLAPALRPATQSTMPRPSSLAYWLQATQNKPPGSFPPGTFKIVTLDPGDPPRKPATYVVLLRGIDGPNQGTDNSVEEATFDEIAGDGRYAAEVRKALESLPRGSHITLIGHSQGGIVARDIVSDVAWARKGGYQIDGVITGESPVSGMYVASGVQHVAEFKNKNDYVTDLNPRAGSSGGSNVDVFPFEGTPGRHSDPGLQLIDADVTKRKGYETYNSLLKNLNPSCTTLNVATYELQ